MSIWRGLRRKKGINDGYRDWAASGSTEMKDLGRTSWAPRGKFQLDDGTEFRMALAGYKHPEVGKWITVLHIEFRFPVAWIGLTKAEAIELVKILFKNTEDIHLPKWRTHALDISAKEGELRVTAVTFRQRKVYSSLYEASISLRVDREKRVLIIDFPGPAISVGLDKADAVTLGRMLIRKAEEL